MGLEDREGLSGGVGRPEERFLGVEGGVGLRGRGSGLPSLVGLGIGDWRVVFEGGAMCIWAEEYIV